MSTCSDSFSSSRANSSASISICSPSSRALGREERSISDPSYHALVGCNQLIYADRSLWLLRANSLERALSLRSGEPGEAVVLRSMGANVHIKSSSAKILLRIIPYRYSEYLRFTVNTLFTPCLHFYIFLPCSKFARICLRSSLQRDQTPKNALCRPSIFSIA